MAKTLVSQMVAFVKFQLADKHCFAPFTGQDYSAWHAFVYAVELYGRGDMSGRANAIEAMRMLVHAAQLKNDVLAVFKKTIPGVLDWDQEHQLWMKVAPVVPPRSDVERDFSAVMESQGAQVKRVVWPCEDGPRICSHIHSKPSKKREGWFDCKSCGAEWRPAIEAAS